MDFVSVCPFLSCLLDSFSFFELLKLKKAVTFCSEMLLHCHLLFAPKDLQS